MLGRTACISYSCTSRGTAGASTKLFRTYDREPTISLRGYWSAEGDCPEFPRFVRGGPVLQFRELMH